MFDAGFLTPDSDAGLWMLNFGCWTLDAGLWTAASEQSEKTACNVIQFFIIKISFGINLQRNT